MSTAKKLEEPEPVLRLYIPELSPVCHPGALVQVSELRKWIQQLPLANIESSSTMMIAELARVVRYPGKSGFRLRDLLELFSDPVAQLTRATIARVARPNTQAFCQRIQENIQLALESQQELGFGFKRLVQSGLASKEGPHIIDILGALEAIWQQSFISALSFQVLPQQLWLEAIELYQLAMQGQQAPTEAHRQAESAFHAIAILWGLDPLRLPPEMTTKLGIMLRNQTGLAAFCRSSDFDPQSIYIALHQHKPTLAVECPETKLPLAKSLGLLKLDQLTESVEQFLKTEAPKLTNKRLSFAEPGTWIWRAVLPLLSHNKAQLCRRHARTIVDRPLKMVCGLNPVQDRMMSLLQIAQTDPQDLEIEYDTLEPSSVLYDQIWVQQHDSSVSGVSVVMLDSDTRELRLGSLILLENESKLDEQPSAYSLGRVRRMRALGDKRLELGIECFSGRLLPVFITSENGQQNERGILHQPGSGNLATLMAPTGLLRSSNRDFILEGPNQQRLKARGRRILDAQSGVEWLEVRTQDFE